MTGVKVVYNNTADYNKNNLTISASSSVTNVNDLKTNEPPVIFASFEKQYMDVDTPYKFYDENDKHGWVTALFNGKGDHTTTEPPYVFFQFNKTVSSRGITLYFSENPEEYAPEVEIEWTVDNNTVSETFYPTSNVFFCEKTVENYNEVYIRIVKWSIPYRRARLYRIEFGQIMTFEDDDVLNASVTEVTNIIPVQVELNTSEISVYYTGFKDETLFKENQKFFVYHNEHLIARHAVSNIEIMQKKINFNGVDLLSTYEAEEINISEFNGLTFENCVALIADGEEVSISIADNSLKSIVVSCSTNEEYDKRKALTALCLAVGAWIDTTRDENITIRKISTYLERTSVLSTITEEYILSGDKFAKNEPYKKIKAKFGGRTVKVTDTGSEATQTLEIEFPIYSTVTESFVRNVLPIYYFRPDVYTAKSVVTVSSDTDYNERVGDLININDQKSIINRRKLILNGKKVFAEGEYKING